MPLLTNFYGFFTSLPPVLFIFGLLATACLILVGQDWRVGVLALLVQYGLVGALLARVGALPAAGVKLLAGVIACWILYLSARTSPPPAQHAKDRIFRLLAAGVLAVGVYGLTTRNLPLEVATDLLMAAGWLVAVGLLVVTWARDPLRVGLGLLTFQVGIEVAYAAVERSLVVLGLLAVVHWSIALAVGLLLPPSPYQGESLGGGLEGSR